MLGVRLWTGKDQTWLGLGGNRVEVNLVVEGRGDRRHMEYISRVPVPSLNEIKMPLPLMKLVKLVMLQLT